MEKDELVVEHLEWLRRMTSCSRIHLGSVEKIKTALMNHLKKIISEKNRTKASIAKNTIALYSHVFETCRMLGGGFLLRGIDYYISELDQLLGISEEHSPTVIISLPEANWSVDQTIVGKIAVVPDNFDFRFEKKDLFLSLRAGHMGTVIYLLKQRPTVKMLNNWPDPNSVIVTSGGGETSEEMNLAMSERIPYINGAYNYYKDLCRLQGKVVTLLPTETKTSKFKKKEKKDQFPITIRPRNYGIKTNILFFTQWMEIIRTLPEIFEDASYLLDCAFMSEVEEAIKLFQLLDVNVVIISFSIKDDIKSCSRFLNSYIRLPQFHKSKLIAIMPDQLRQSNIQLYEKVKRHSFKTLPGRFTSDELLEAIVEAANECYSKRQLHSAQKVMANVKDIIQEAERYPKLWHYYISIALRLIASNINSIREELSKQSNLKFFVPTTIPEDFRQIILKTAFISDKVILTSASIGKTPIESGIPNGTEVSIVPLLSFDNFNLCSMLHRSFLDVMRDLTPILSGGKIIYVPTPILLHDPQNELKIVPEKIYEQWKESGDLPPIYTNNRSGFGILTAGDFEAMHIEYGDLKLPKNISNLFTVRLRIPYIEGIDLKTLSALEKDEREVFARFRNALLFKSNEIEKVPYDNYSSKRLQTITRELEAEVDVLNQRFQKIKTHKWFQASKVSLEILLLSITVISKKGLLKTIESVVDSKGGPQRLIPYANYLKEKIEAKESPSYLLWTIDSSMKE